MGFGPISARPALETQFWLAKIDEEVLSDITKGETEFILYLIDQADLRGAKYLKTRQEKGQFVFQSLTTVARRSQRPIVEALTGFDVEFRPFWIANMIWVRGDSNVLSAMAKRNDVNHIYPNPKVQLEKPVVTPIGKSIQSNSSIEWNISKVRAPEVWAEGYRGQGIVIGGQDTGYEWDHPALKSQYRGWDGTSVDHNYNWHDAIHTSILNPCGNDSPIPCDDHGLSHGTHTMGTIVGEDASLTRQIGMAPEAKWIGCRNMDQGVGTPATYAECYQWFLAPTDLNDLNPDPVKAPHVINNSWSCPVDEGCTDPQVLQSVVEAVRAAGILTVHSAGNKGTSGCSSIDAPAAIYDASFTVGNTNSSDTIVASSSRGPVTIDGSGRIKPDISAPGKDVISSVKSGEYAPLSGTSMAAPHVAGLAALLFSAQPDLIGQVDQIERIITRTAVPVQVDPNYPVCGGIPGDVYPNNWEMSCSSRCLAENNISLETCIPAEKNGIIAGVIWISLLRV
jgi:subtilisin family serine protease